MVLERLNNLQIPAFGLFEFNGFEQCLEVPFAKTAAAFALKDLKEYRGPIFDRLAKYLKQVPLFIFVHEYTETADLIQRLIQMTDAFRDQFVVRIGHAQEFNAV